PKCFPGGAGYGRSTGRGSSDDYGPYGPGCSIRTGEPESGTECIQSGNGIMDSGYLLLPADYRKGILHENGRGTALIPLRTKTRKGFGQGLPAQIPFPEGVLNYV